MHYEKLTREFQIELARGAVNEKARTVELSFSSEAPIQRHFGTEILDHSPTAVDLSRLNGGGPLLVDHNTRDQVGVVEEARIGADRKGRAKVRFGKGARAQEIFQDVVDGIRRLVSVGYDIRQTKSEEGGVVRATEWTPLEISLVSVPADVSVGIGRNGEGIVRMNNNEEEARQSQIVAITERLKSRIPSITDLSSQAILAGWSVEEFRTQALRQMPEVQPIRPAEPLDVKPKDWARYSITRAISAQIKGGGLNGLERELSDEIAKKVNAQPAGFWVPGEALLRRDRAGQLLTRDYVAGTGTLGGMLVSTVNDGSQFIELLRNRAQVVNLGARVINLDAPITIPRQSGAGSANWVGETVAATLSVGDFTQVTLTPLGVSAFQQYAKQLLITSNPSIDALVRDDINQILAIAIDKAALHGSGSPQPTGIAGTTGINTVALATNGQALANATAYPAMVSLETLISTDNADVATMGYLMNSAARGALKVTPRFANQDTPVWGDGNRVNGYRAEVTNQIATNLTTGTATTICSAVFFGNWNDLFLAQFNGGATDLVVDPYTLAANAVVRLIARRWVDIAARHAESFAILGGIL